MRWFFLKKRKEKKRTFLKKNTPSPKPFEFINCTVANTLIPPTWVCYTSGRDQGKDRLPLSPVNGIIAISPTRPHAGKKIATVMGVCLRWWRESLGRLKSELQCVTWWRVWDSPIAVASSSTCFCLCLQQSPIFCLRSSNPNLSLRHCCKRLH